MASIVYQVDKKTGKHTGTNYIRNTCKQMASSNRVPNFEASCRLTLPFSQFSGAETTKPMRNAILIY